MLDTIEILENVIWLVNAFDDEALGEMQDIPLLEVAKSVTIAPLPAGFVSTSQALERRMPPRYPTNRKILTKKTMDAAKKNDERKP